MELSILLAKIMGLFLVIVFVSVLVNKKLVPNLVKDVSKDTSFMLFSGAMTLILGLLLVLNHNIWTADWVGLVTLFGWLVMIKGAVLVLFPEQTPDWAVKINNTAITVGSIIMLVVGIYLTYAGFTV